MASLEGCTARAFRAASSFHVTTGLDPVVHAKVRLTMDCRIKSGNDEW
jgi:hypothetical protein